MANILSVDARPWICLSASVRLKLPSPTMDRNIRPMNALALLVLLLMTGCVRLPVRVDSQIQGPGGAGTFADMGKIQPEKSTRQDVLRDWEWCNAHLDSNRLFVGKVVHSKTKNIDMMGPIYMGSEGRQWDDENLFVEFDDKGTVTKAYLGSHRDFLRQISSWVRQTELPPLDLSKPIQIKGTIQTGSFSHKLWALHGVVLLAAEGLDFRSEDENGPHLVHVNIGQVEAIGGDYWSGQHLKLRGVPGWSNVNLELTMPDVFLLVRYLKQVREPALPRS